MTNRFVNNETPVTDVVIVASRKFADKFEPIANELRSHGLIVHTPASPAQTKIPNRTDANIFAMGTISITKALLVCNYDSEQFGQNGVSWNVAMEMAIAFFCGIPIFLLNDAPLGKQADILFTQPTILQGDLTPLIEFTQTKKHTS